MFRKVYFVTMVIGIIAAIYIVCPGVLSGTSQRSTLSITPAQQVSQSEPSTAASPAVFPVSAQTTYQMDLYLDAIQRTMYGQSVVQTSNTSGQVLNELWFTLYPRAFRLQTETPAPIRAYYAGFDSGDMVIQDITVNDEKAEYNLDGISLQIKLPRDILPDQPVKVNIGWQNRIPRVSYRYGTSEGVFMLGNCYPVLNVLTREGWHKSYNSSFGDPFCLASADYLVRINLPEQYRLATSGQTAASLALDNGRVCHVLAAQQIRDFCITAFSDCEEIQAVHGKVKIFCYVPPGSAKEGQTIITQAEQILDFYDRQWGSYPYPEFKIAMVPMQGFEGMEYAGLIYLQQDLLQNPGNLQYLLAHEIAHQWWYGLVGSDQLIEPWLDEGLAGYGARLYIEAATSGSAAKEGNRPAINLNRELQDFASRDEYHVVAYQGGASYWAALEKTLGRDTVQKILRGYLATYKYGLATSVDIKSMIKQEAPENIQAFEAGWFR